MQKPKRSKTMDFVNALENAIFAGGGDDRAGDGAAMSPLGESLELQREDEEAGQRAAKNASNAGGAMDVCELDEATPAARG